jgi:hypothetical protein
MLKYMILYFGDQNFTGRRYKSGRNGLSRGSHYQYQPFIRKQYQSSDAGIMEYLPQKMVWNYQ